MKNNEINLLPSKYQFDFNKHVAVRTSIAVIVCNIILLGVIYYCNITIIDKLNKNLSQKQAYHNKLVSLNSNFSKYEQVYENKKKQLSDAKSKLRELMADNQKNNSPVIDSLRLFEFINRNIYVSSFSYGSGTFNFNGTAANDNAFYRFYKDLEQSEVVTRVNFLSLNRTDDSRQLKFKVKITMEPFYEH
ncbi:PilN domain-containing protein [Flexistipes sinusarabici]|uniref:PilN domain-containing protein n=1 Tax=Flexistipes sinusarabici TaxID=2352 RepID=UPI00235281E9|nr:PilN domain-containing protein [Flexistipes sinusarabici]